MGNLKRFLAMTLTMLMVVGCFGAFSSVAAFDDVVDYQDQISLMNTLGIVQGYDEDEFGYGEDVERWHMALWIAKIMTGKVDDAYANWYNSENYTAFKDVEEYQFLGSISYCNENGVIIGTSATTFEPAEGIKIQDVFTMVVRMLGYGSASMDANYPWSYIDKAIQLGLDKGLVADYNNEDIATREQSAVILYNALFALKADGTTYAESKFNLTISTVVITGTYKANMFTTSEVITRKTDDGSEYYVGINVLGDDGNVLPTTYYLPKSDLLPADADENLYFGHSFNVVSNDNYGTLLYCAPVDPVYLDQTEFEGTNTDNSLKVQIEGTEYTAVTGYTNLNNRANESKTFRNYEIIVFDTTGEFVVYGSGSYKMDANLNILDKDGNILLYYFPNRIGATNQDKYLYKVAADQYVEPDAAIWAKAARVDTKTITGTMVKLSADTFNAKAMYGKNAYNDTKLFDDNGDGTYDRALYTYYKFGFLSYNPDNNRIQINGADLKGDTKYTNVTYVDADGNKIEPAVAMAALDTALTRGNYVLYSFNPQTNYMTIKEFFEPTMGLVTAVNKTNATITFDAVYYNIYAGNVAGTTYSIGYSRLPGASFAAVSEIGLDDLQGKNVHYIEKDGRVLKIYNVNKNGAYMVFDQIVGYTSTGYANALVYNNSNIKTVVTISMVDGSWYYNYTGLTLNPNLTALNKGDLLYATVDALGNYNVTKVTDYTYYYDQTQGRRMQDDVRIYFINGIAVPKVKLAGTSDWLDLTEYNEVYFENRLGVAKDFVQFRATADTVFVIKNAITGELQAHKGVPLNGAYIDVYDSTRRADAKIFVQDNADTPLLGKFVYVVDGLFEGSVSTTDPWGYKSNDTIIYIDSDAKSSEVITNQISAGLGVIAGATYSYSYAIDVVNGGFYTGNVYTYNQQLKLGSFYRVVGGYVQEEVVPGDKSDIRVGNLEYIDTYRSVVLPNKGDAISINYKTQYLYQLSTAGYNITNKDGTTDRTPKNMLNDMKANINKYGVYAAVYYYAGSLSSSSNVLIYTSINNSNSTNFNVVAGTVRYSTVTIEKKFNSTLEYFNAVPASGLTAQNWFQIDKATYDAFSILDHETNDDNNRVFARMGTALRLYKDGVWVETFNTDNVTGWTKVMRANAEETRYYLVLTAKSSNVTTDIGDGGTGYSLVWVNPNNLLQTYTLALPSLGIKANPAPDPDPVDYTLTLQAETYKEDGTAAAADVGAVNLYKANATSTALLTLAPTYTAKSATITEKTALVLSVNEVTNYDITVGYLVTKADALGGTKEVLEPVLPEAVSYTNGKLIYTFAMPSANSTIKVNYTYNPNDPVATFNVTTNVVGNSAGEATAYVGNTLAPATAILAGTDVVIKVKNIDDYKVSLAASGLNATAISKVDNSDTAYSYYKLTMPAANVTVTVTYTEITVTGYTLGITTNPTTATVAAFVNNAAFNIGTQKIYKDDVIAIVIPAITGYSLTVNNVEIKANGSPFNGDVSFTKIITSSEYYVVSFKAPAANTVVNINYVADEVIPTYAVTFKTPNGAGNVEIFVNGVKQAAGTKFAAGTELKINIPVSYRSQGRNYNLSNIIPDNSAYYNSLIQGSLSENGEVIVCYLTVLASDVKFDVKYERETIETPEIFRLTLAGDAKSGAKVFVDGIEYVIGLGGNYAILKGSNVVVAIKNKANNEILTKSNIGTLAVLPATIISTDATFTYYKLNNTDDAGLLYDGYTFTANYKSLVTPPTAATLNVTSTDDIAEDDVQYFVNGSWGSTIGTYSDGESAYIKVPTSYRDDANGKTYTFNQFVAANPNITINGLTVEIGFAGAEVILIAGNNEILAEYTVVADVDNSVELSVSSRWFVNASSIQTGDDGDVIEYYNGSWDFTDTNNYSIGESAFIRVQPKFDEVGGQWVFNGLTGTPGIVINNWEAGIGYIGAEIVLSADAEIIVEYIWIADDVSIPAEVTVLSNRLDSIGGQILSGFQVQFYNFETSNWDDIGNTANYEVGDLVVFRVLDQVQGNWLWYLNGVADFDVLEAHNYNGEGWKAFAFIITSPSRTVNVDYSLNPSYYE